MLCNACILLLALILAGCSGPLGGSVMGFGAAHDHENLECWQAAVEGDRVSRRVSQITGHDHATAKGSGVTDAIVILVWPIDMPSIDVQTASELNRLKGEFEALARVSADKNCKFLFRQVPPQATRHD